MSRQTNTVSHWMCLFGSPSALSDFFLTPFEVSGKCENSVASHLCAFLFHQVLLLARGRALCPFKNWGLGQNTTSGPYSARAIPEYSDPRGNEAGYGKRKCSVRVFMCALTSQCTFLPFSMLCNVAYTSKTQRGEPHDEVTQDFYTGVSLLSQFDSRCDALIVSNHLVSPSCVWSHTQR